MAHTCRPSRFDVETARDDQSKPTSAEGKVTMSEPLPALCLIAMPGRRRRTIEVCQETERRGFAGIYTPSPFGKMSLCEALSWNTASITFGTSIAKVIEAVFHDSASHIDML